MREKRRRKKHHLWSVLGYMVWPFQRILHLLSPLISFPLTLTILETLTSISRVLVNKLRRIPLPKRRLPKLPVIAYVLGYKKLPTVTEHTDDPIDFQAKGRTKPDLPNDTMGNCCGDPGVEEGARDLARDQRARTLTLESHLIRPAYSTEYNRNISDSNETDSNATIQELKKELNKLKTENINLQEKNKDVQHLQRENENLKHQIQKHLQEQAHVQRELQEDLRKQEQLKDKQISTLQDEIEGLQKDKKTLRVDVAILTQNSVSTKIHQEKVTKLEKDLEHLQRSYDELRLVESEKEQMHYKYQIAMTQKNKELDDMTCRYSKAVSDNLRLGNAALEDLSTANRPLKLAERFQSDLYGNAWCDGLDELTDGGLDEQIAISLLFTVVKSVYEDVLSYRCQLISADFNRLFFPNVDSQDNTSVLSTPHAVAQRPVDRMTEQIVMDLLRKTFCRNTVVSLKQLYNKERHGLADLKITLGEKIESFIDLALELCWLFVIQDPPMVLMYQLPGDKRVDLNMYQFYDRPATFAKCVVWPALLLHTDGNVLNKGKVVSDKQPDVPLQSTEISASVL